MSGEPCRISVIRDVTKQRRAERESQDQRQQMAHLMRVALLGQLSGALAHELNQPLTAILSNAQAAQRFLKRDSVDLAEMRAILDDIVGDDKRAGEVIQRLRALLKRGEAQFQRVNMNEVVTETLKLAHGDLIARNVMVETSFAARNCLCTWRSHPAATGFPESDYQCGGCNGRACAGRASNSDCHQGQRRPSSSFGRRPRSRNSGGSDEQVVRAVFHDQGAWSGIGAVDLALDRSRALRAVVGREQSRIAAQPSISHCRCRDDEHGFVNASSANGLHR